MNEMTLQYLDEQGQQDFFERACSIMSNRNITEMVSGLTRRSRTIFWVVFLVKFKAKATKWYLSSKENQFLIMESLFCGRVDKTLKITKEPDPDLYKTKCEHVEWTLREFVPTYKEA